MKAVVGAFNQEKALVGTFSLIVQFHRLIVTALVLFTFSLSLSIFSHKSKLSQCVSTYDDDKKGDGDQPGPGFCSSSLLPVQLQLLVRDDDKHIICPCNLLSNSLN